MAKQKYRIGFEDVLSVPCRCAKCGFSTCFPLKVDTVVSLESCPSCGEEWIGNNHESQYRKAFISLVNGLQTLARMPNEKKNVRVFLEVAIQPDSGDESGATENRNT